MGPLLLPLEVGGAGRGKEEEGIAEANGGKFQRGGWHGG